MFLHFVPRVHLHAKIAELKIISHSEKLMPGMSFYGRAGVLPSLFESTQCYCWLSAVVKSPKRIPLPTIVSFRFPIKHAQSFIARHQFCFCNQISKKRITCCSLVPTHPCFHYHHFFIVSRHHIVHVDQYL